MGSAAMQAQVWGANPDDWANLQEGFHKPVWIAALDSIGAGAGKKVLDAGCGSGGASVEAARRGAEVTGLDASPALLGVARKRLPNAKFDEGDLESLPYADQTFDGVLAAHSVFYAADMHAAMKELARVVKSKGRVAITAWGKPEDCQMKEVFGAMASVLPPPPPGAGGPFALSAAGALDGLLEKAGLRPVGKGQTQCDFNFGSVDEGWRALAASGPLQGAFRKVGEDKVKAAVVPALGRFADASGKVHIKNVFLWATGERP